MDKAVEWCPGLTEADRAMLRRIEANMPIVADLSRADLLLYGRQRSERAVVLAHAQPHSVLPVYLESQEGHRVTQSENPNVFLSLDHGKRVRGSRRLIADGAPVVQRVYPIRNSHGHIIAALSIEANLIAEVRQRSRSRVFQRAVNRLQKLLITNRLPDLSPLSPFGEHDGIMVVDQRGIIRYMSGIAANLYRRLGYQESLIGRPIASLATADVELVLAALEKGQVVEQEAQERERIWVRKAIPLIYSNEPRPWWDVISDHLRREAVILMIHDATEARQREQQLKVKTAMIREIHHRVKNNLQAVAAMLRIQARRVQDPQGRQALLDSVNRILSVAVVHEYLSNQESGAINLREVSQRIINQMVQGVLSPDKQIRFSVSNGPPIYLPARQATACALVINELLQNAVEHGFEDRSEGEVTITLEDEGDHIVITVADNGQGLPEGFNLETTSSLGLKIVRTLVHDDLQGIMSVNGGDGVHVHVRFPKHPLGGEELWNEFESS